MINEDYVIHREPDMIKENKEFPEKIRANEAHEIYEKIKSINDSKDEEKRNKLLYRYLNKIKKRVYKDIRKNANKGLSQLVYTKYCNFSCGSLTELNIKKYFKFLVDDGFDVNITNDAKKKSGMVTYVNEFKVLISW